MEKLLKQELNTEKLEKYGHGAGGCISSGQAYSTDTGLIFVKFNEGSNARVMFDGEAASLREIIKTGTIKTPKPIKVFDQPKGGAALAMEYIDINSLSRQAAVLGEKLARMHLHNEDQRKQAEKAEGFVHKDTDLGAGFVGQFGFHVMTCCGYISQDNTWHDDWVTFFTRNRLQQQLDLIEKEYGDRETIELWPKLQRMIPLLFKDLDVRPALVHGDLWGGNVGEDSDGPVIFDPSCFYAHSEYELGIAMMFGGFSSDFFKAYHTHIPKTDGFTKRNSLYKLFHYLNHWNHFGSGYRGSSLSIMRDLCKS